MRSFKFLNGSFSFIIAGVSFSLIDLYRDFLADIPNSNIYTTIFFVTSVVWFVGKSIDERNVYTPVIAAEAPFSYISLEMNVVTTSIALISTFIFWQGVILIFEKITEKRKKKLQESSA